MPFINEGNLNDYVDPSVRYVPLEHIENRMNEGDPSRLTKYLDPEFLDAHVDDKAKDAGQIELEDKEKLDLEFDLDEAIADQLAEARMGEALLNPREYQFELYQRALEENIIVVLDTGAGKTLISVMLIKSMVLQEREARLTRRETKLAFFLVERVPLVFQQANVIKANCDVNLEQMCGEMEVDTWSEKRWAQIFEENDVCVMTAQIFLDTLRHGYLSLERVHLIVFDECHHATKRHPFNLIMREFYDRCPIDKRPKIFGMTASPMHSRSSVESSVVQLEKNLDARVYTAKNLEVLNQSINKGKEFTVEYESPRNYDETPLATQVRLKLGSIPRYRRCFIVTSDILRSLGPWCSDLMWKIMLTDLERKMSHATQNLDRQALMQEDLMLKETHEFIDTVPFERNPDLTNTNLFTNKIQLLINILKIFVNGTPDFCGIVFVERRHTAVAIQKLIEALDDLSKVRSSILIGHGTTDEGDIQMTFRDQNKTIEKFRTGELNLLIATNVAEEGLDIQPCNVVIRFDFFHTLIAYIQSRGRARKKDSKYVVFVESQNVTQHSNFQDFRVLEAEMKQFCQLMPEERNVANKFFTGTELDLDSSDDEDSDDEDYLEYSIVIPETGATITKQNAVSLLHKYCGSLPSDSFCVLKPIYEISTTGEGFICKLTLPSNAAIQELTSPVVRSKTTAKALVSLQACEQLRTLDALDAHLMPYNYRREILGEMAPQFDENGYIIGSRRRHGMYEKRTPKFWERETEEDEEEEIVDVEDNPDLLQAQVNSTTVRITDQVYNSDGSAKREDGNAKDLTVIKPEPTLTVTEEVSVPVVQNGSLDQALPNGTLELNGTSNESQQNDASDQLVPNGHHEHEVSEENREEEEEELGEGPFPCWFTILEVQLPDNKLEGIPYRRLCLISKKPFPEFPDLKLFHQSIPFMVKVRNLETEISLDRETVLHLSSYMLKLMLALINKEFECPAIDVPYYIVPLVRGCEDSPFESLLADQLKEMVDWKEVDRITESKVEPFVLDGDAADTIVIDGSDNMRRYFVTKVTDMTPSSQTPEGSAMRQAGFETFRDYYLQKKHVEQIEDNQPLLQVKRLKKVMNFLYPGYIVPAKEKGPVQNYSIPSLCQRFFMSASVYQATCMIPSIMTRIDSLLLCRQSVARYDLPIHDAEILEAYTTPSASMEMNYERLETLGDSLLKFIATIRLYINFPFSNEGELHHLRIRVICNRALYRSAKRLKFYRYITSRAFNRRYWRPPHFKSPADNAETIEGLNYHRLSDKTLADIVEASLGAAYLSNGLEGGLHAAIQLQIPFDEIKTWSDFQPAFENTRKTLPPRAQVSELRKIDLPELYRVTGREFKQPLLVVEALTHASLPNSTVPCYQRLEFLGDAILDFLVIRYLFSKYPDADPGIITDLKDSCVNNHILGIVCIEVGLYKHIIHYSGRLIRAIEQFVGEVDEVKEKGEAIGEYWVDFNTPKVLSDVVESMLGATFVDAGFRLEPVEDLFAKWFLPILDNHVTPELIRVHPLRKFLTDLQRFGCDGFMLRNHCTGGTGPDSQKCVIFLHDKPLACGSDWNIKTARRHAATKAMERLKDEPGLLESVCNCRISMVKRGLMEDTRKQHDEEEVED